MRALAVALALSAGCGQLYSHPLRTMVVADVLDVGLVVAGTTVAATSDSGVVSGLGITTDVVALTAIPILVMYTFLSMWNPD